MITFTIKEIEEHLENYIEFLLTYNTENVTRTDEVIIVLRKILNELKNTGENK